ncbi:MAG TPA: hypothetical protein VIK52_14215 [Opitutaceae bacterium]
MNSLLSFERLEQVRVWKDSVLNLFTTAGKEREIAETVQALLAVTTVDVVFDAQPGPQGGRFVEVEDAGGKSIAVGEWLHREDGYHVLRLRVIP